MRHKVTSASRDRSGNKAARENGEKMDDVHAEFREKRERGGRSGQCCASLKVQEPEPLARVPYRWPNAKCPSFR